MHLFYAPKIIECGELPEKESQHCIRVMRHQVHDIIQVTDGCGNLFQAKILDPNPRCCKTEIVQSTYLKPTWNAPLEIAIAVLKNPERMDWFVEKATEMGIDTIHPYLSQHCERRHCNIERLEKVAIAAMKQSEKVHLPKINELIDFNQLLRHTFDGERYIAHCREAEKPLLSHLLKVEKPSLILIGPEGDFSENEVANAIKLGFRAVSLGETRLRAETAALLACQSYHIVNQLSTKNN